MKDRIPNDVRTGWLSVITAYNRIGVTQQFMDQGNLTGNSLQPGAIVELSQTRLTQTEAQMPLRGATIPLYLDRG